MPAYMRHVPQYGSFPQNATSYQENATYYGGMAQSQGWPARGMQPSLVGGDYLARGAYMRYYKADE